ncbi:MAG: DUF4197 domain-containing protein, partial [Povalibacter sp.]
MNRRRVIGKFLVRANVMLKILGLSMSLVIAASAFGGSAGDITNSEASNGLKQALVDGSAKAVSLLGVENGFFSNPKVKIPLPPALQKIEAALRYTGMRKQADELVLAMNRAAEAAVPEAKALLVESVRKMSISDAKGVLTGGDTAATDYFRRTTESQLTDRFLPIVKKATDRVGLAQQYNSLAGQAAQLGLIREQQASIERYVT